MGTNITGIGNANAIGFKSRVTGGIYFPPELKDALVGVWSAYGKSNDSTDRNIIKNKIKDRGGDFVISNAAFKLNSGFGGFVEDFTSWDRIDSSTAEISNDGSKIKCINTTLNVQYLFNYINRDISSFKVKISNFTKGDITYYYRKEDGIEAFFKITPLSVINSDKVIELPKSYNTVENGTGSRGGFYSSNINIGVTIEQIPSFEGAFVTDGIDDLITSTKTVQEMGVTDEITIVSMIHQIQLNPSSSITNDIRVSSNDTSGSNGRIVVSAKNKTGIYGWSRKGNTKVIITKILGDKNDYSLAGENSTNYNNKFSVVGTVDNRYNSSVAWYWTIIANKELTTDQINQVIAYFNLDRTLKPDMLCNVKKQGITNENHAEFGDKLIDFSGNGRDIQLNNIAWDGDSGIGKYNYPNWKVNVTQGNKYARIVYYDSINGTYSANFKGITDLYKSYGLSIEIRINRANTVDFHSIKEDGIYTVTPPDDTKSIDIRFGGENVYNASCDITITQIPSHAGALCLDGINDFGKVTGMPIYKDYTFIIDYERISYASSEKGVAGVVSKSHVANQGAFILMIANTKVELGKQTYSFGGVTSFNRDDFTRALLYQSKYKCGDVDLTVGGGVDSDTLWLGTFRDNDQRFFNGAIYSLMSFPYSMSEFLIERQLKKHKLGTLYPDMVEFRPVIKANNDYEIVYTAIIKPDNWQEISIGDYVTVGKSVAIQIKLNNPLEVTNVSSNSLADISFYKEENSDNIYTIYGRVLDGKSPQKITIDIQVDSSLVQWNPVVESTAEYSGIGYLNYSHNLATINVGDYISIGDIVAIRVILDNTVDEIVNCKVNGQECEIVNVSPRVFDCKFTLTSESPQNINITIDEYIRYEDIVQPYPVLLRFNDENGNEVSWGGKFKVGSNITRIGSIADPESNLLNGLYSISGLSLNGKAVTSSTSIVEKQMVFKTTATWLLDNNEPKVILSPSRLRIPNSSYKLLGYIPDISGHGNNGVIYNSAYAEGSGVNEDGSYQFDGVDDFVTIPTTVGGKQVLMKVNWDTPNASVLYDQRGYNNEFAIYSGMNDSYNNPIPAYQGRNNGQTYIDGILNKNIKVNELRAITHNITITNELSLGTNKTYPIIGSSKSNAYFVNMALYDFMLFDNISTDDKIKELNEYVGIEAKVELPPYYWDAYGKTNLDADKATIQQRGVAVGDYDLTNTNFAYDKMSGFGGYEFEKFTDTTKWIETKREDGIEVIEKNDYSFTAKKVGTGQYFWDFKNNSIKTLDRDLTVKAISNNNVYIRWEFKYRTAEKPDIYSTIILLRQAMTPNVPITVTLPYKTQEEQTELGVVEGSTYYLFCFDPSDIPVGDEYTVEMLPLYPNGLLYDAVNDYSENVNIPVFTDFTAIMKRKWLKNQGCPLIKGSKVYEGGNGNALLFEWDKAYNFVFYKRTDIMEREVPENISFITPTNYNGNVITRGSGQDTNGICIAGDGNAGFANIIFYKLILYPKTIPLLQINFLKNLMERDEIIDLNNPIFIKNE